MSDERQVISPRGIPPIRPDWLIDVAWRLADLQLDHLRGWAESGLFTLEDIVDGGRWAFESTRLTPSWSTAVEHESDLKIPTDTTKATLRAAFAFTPWFDDETGRCVHARIEIGPRGPVTFDPENWMVLLPLPGSGTERPELGGVEFGLWNFGQSGSETFIPFVDASELAGTSLDLADLALVLDDDKPVPELLLPAYAFVTQKRLFGRERRVPADILGPVARIEADGPLQAAWSGNISIAELGRGGRLVVDEVDERADVVSIRGETGVLTLTGPGARLSVLNPATA